MKTTQLKCDDVESGVVASGTTSTGSFTPKIQRDSSPAKNILAQAIPPVPKAFLKQNGGAFWNPLISQPTHLAVV